MARLQRLLRTRLTALQRALARRATLTPARIHRLRQSIKQARALLRLLRPALRSGAWRSTDAALRAAGIALRSARDRVVILDTLASLGRHRPYLDPAVRGVLQHWLRHYRGLYPLEPAQADVQKALARMRTIESARSDCLRAAAADRAARLALRQCYRRGRRAWRMALRTGASRDWHVCRRHAKYLYYQLGFLTAGNTSMRVLRASAKDLGHVLGQEHDLAVLRDALEHSGVDASPGGAAIIDCIAQGRSRLRHRAHALAARVYEHRSRAFGHTLQQAGASFEPARCVRAQRPRGTRG